MIEGLTVACTEGAADASIDGTKDGSKVDASILSSDWFNTKAKEKPNPALIISLDAFVFKIERTRVSTNKCLPAREDVETIIVVSMLCLECCGACFLLLKDTMI